MKNDYLEHHGILGQRWGVRRYQNEDGSLTPAGKKRAYQLKIEARKNLNREKNKLNELNKQKSSIESDTAYRDDIYDLMLETQDLWDYKNNRLLSDKEVNSRIDKFNKAYQKALSENKDYQRVLKEIESQNTKVKDLESLANTKSGRDYVKYALVGLGSVAAVSAGMIVIDYIANHK